MTGPISFADRRRFLGRSCLGFGALALEAILAREGLAGSGFLPHAAPKAKSVIWLFMNGGTSHLESFDSKPELDKYAGKTISETPYKDVQNPNRFKDLRVVAKGDANGQQRHRLLARQIGFQKRGQSGIPVSDWYPHLGSMIDEMAIVKSMWTTDDNHGAQTQFHSGRHMLDGEFPNLGAWVNYGLGTLNENLPQFISMGTREYWNKRDGHYLGPSHDAVPVKVDTANPLDFGRPESDMTFAEQKSAFGLLDKLGSIAATKRPFDRDLAARLQSYELAFRMQKSLPEVMDFAQETEATRNLYGLDRSETRPFGQQLLATRRLVEKGVRFVQIQHGGGGAGAWDAHEGLKGNHATLCQQTDKPMAGLLLDLKRRGLLETTLVVWATEFGRTPGTQGSTGRDHHPFAFSIWMAGGGIKGGIAHGETDELGFHAVSNRHYVTDVHATILHLMGLDSRKLEIPERKRLEIDHGQVIKDILA